MKEIKAGEGMYLTQVGEVADRIFVRALKGANIREEDWRDATEEERREYESKQAENEENTTALPATDRL